MTNIQTNFKKGAASFYIVAFSTLILLIVVTSFAAIIISEITRTSNDDLSQSAYDSALAGVEDAKLAYYNYQKCLADGATAAKPSGNPISCNEIVWYMQEAEGQDCDMVSHILGRVGTLESSETIIKEDQTATNNMEQAYTCTKISKAKDYKGTLSSSQPIKVIKTKFDSVPSDRITKIQISWYNKQKADSPNLSYTNFDNNSNTVKFPNNQETAAPPTISVALVQTAETFNLKDFESTIGEGTDRGMVYLVPTNDSEAAKANKPNNYQGAWNDAGNTIPASAMLKSNSKTATNLPYAVYCDEASTAEFTCNTEINLPKPVNGARNDNTFMFVVSLPYGKPSTDFSVKFFCDESDLCQEEEFIASEDDENTGTEITTESTKTNQVTLDESMQLVVDSTGRANDLYRRVEARLESATNSSYLAMMGPLELLGKNDSGSELLKKLLAPTTEYNFD